MTTTENKTANADQSTPILQPLTLAPGRALVLRVCHAGRVSHAREANGFTYPDVGGEVAAPDWRPTAVCGYGLHGWLWGAGSVESAGADWAFQTGANAEWLVLEVDASNVIQLNNGSKCKFPSAVVRYVGKLADCAALIMPHAPVGTGIIGAVASAGPRGTASAGPRGTASAGDGGTASAGDGGTASAGPRGTASAGDGGTASAGPRGTASAGDGGTASAGDGGTASAGD
nr:hypothetical protein [Kofleriaceae bacterium]